MAEAVVRKAHSIDISILDRENQVKAQMYVYSCHKLLSPLTKSARNKRRTRTRTYGTILKRSDFQPRFWLVKFQNNKSFYCTHKVFTIVDNTSPIHALCADKDRNIGM